jgi:hypothetical protein
LKRRAPTRLTTTSTHFRNDVVEETTAVGCIRLLVAYSFAYSALASFRDRNVGVGVSLSIKAAIGGRLDHRIGVLLSKFRWGTGVPARVFGKVDG